MDLFPPPQPYTAPNCIFEVDDITQNWTWNNKFDLVHMRNMLGAMNACDWNKLYRHTYDNLAPGGWIEHVEQDVGIYCDDDTLPKDSILREWKEIFIGCAERADRPLDTYDHMKDRIEAVGFTNVHYQDYKLPVGTWPKLGVYKDAGRVCRSQFMLGMEGWGMFLLTKAWPDLRCLRVIMLTESSSERLALGAARSFWCGVRGSEMTWMLATISTIRREESGLRSRTIGSRRLRSRSWMRRCSQGLRARHSR